MPNKKKKKTSKNKKRKQKQQNKDKTTAGMVAAEDANGTVSARVSSSNQALVGSDETPNKDSALLLDFLGWLEPGRNEFWDAMLKTKQVWNPKDDLVIGKLDEQTLIAGAFDPKTLANCLPHTADDLLNGVIDPLKLADCLGPMLAPVTVEFALAPGKRHILNSIVGLHFFGLLLDNSPFCETRYNASTRKCIKLGTISL